ncbi:HEXXH motif-containing protein [Actinophytocola oryzae]|uniref:HEXXH motif-containing protein n=2 Tax=Actinophytocola oryzae TaxID=502181 RepID=A0A4R7VR73_9PSEU|nr:HEXXH motif-containing protein [Actinophytocola oryzae]
MVQRLRRAERSRRKLLLRALMENSAKAEGLCGPLPPLDAVWELLARVEDISPKAIHWLLSHPYTGSWIGYTTRLLRNRIDGVCPLWVHVGQAHALAAAAAIRAGLDFDIDVPVWEGNAALPSLGVARLAASEPFEVATVVGRKGHYAVTNGISVTYLPQPLESTTDTWWAVRRARIHIGNKRFSLHLDDLDPYRGLYEPILPQRTADDEINDWERLIADACQLVAAHLPGLAESMPVGLTSLVPKPQVLFQNPSASTGEAFGSAVVCRPTDGASLAATLIHEFQHIVLGGILHLTQLVDHDPSERIYVAWRDDPRPVSGALQGVYAFFGATMFWRALRHSDSAVMANRAAFEFAYWRRQSWRTLEVLRAEPVLTEAGQRFLDGVAERLGAWQHEPVPRESGELAAAAAADHWAGWRLRHLRPDPAMVVDLTNAWLAGHSRPPVNAHTSTLQPTPVPDGRWSHARPELIRLRVSDPAWGRLPNSWCVVPEATAADFAYTTGRFTEAACGFRAELADDPDRPASLVGLGLALAAQGADPAARALLHRPETVRAVHRRLRHTAGQVPTPEQVASWIGQNVAE